MLIKLNDLNIKREVMPQIPSARRDEFLAYLDSLGISHRIEVVQASSLRPTQSELNLGLVFKILSIGLNTMDFPVLTSSDAFLLDGHNRWYGAKLGDLEMKVVRIDCPIIQLLTLARLWSGVQYTAVQNTEKVYRLAAA